MSNIPEAETRPTDERAGPDIEPTRVQCPYCERTGVTEMAVNMCRCGRWFEVVPDEPEPPEPGADIEAERAMVEEQG